MARWHIQKNRDGFEIIRDDGGAFSIILTPVPCTSAAGNILVITDASRKALHVLSGAGASCSDDFSMQVSRSVWPAFNGAWRCSIIYKGSPIGETDRADLPWDGLMLTSFLDRLNGSFGVHTLDMMDEKDAHMMPLKLERFPGPDDWGLDVSHSSAAEAWDSCEGMFISMTDFLLRSAPRWVADLAVAIPSASLRQRGEDPFSDCLFLSPNAGILKRAADTIIEDPYRSSAQDGDEDSALINVENRFILFTANYFIRKLKTGIDWCEAQRGLRPELAGWLGDMQASLREPYMSLISLTEQESFRSLKAGPPAPEFSRALSEREGYCDMFHLWMMSGPFCSIMPIAPLIDRREYRSLFKLYMLFVILNLFTGTTWSFCVGSTKGGGEHECLPDSIFAFSGTGADGEFDVCICFCAEIGGVKGRAFRCQPPRRTGTPPGSDEMAVMDASLQAALSGKSSVRPDFTIMVKKDGAWRAAAVMNADFDDACRRDISSETAAAFKSSALPAAAVITPSKRDVSRGASCIPIFGAPSPDEEVRTFLRQFITGGRV